MFKLSTKSKQHREGVSHKLIEVGDLAIQITLVDFGYPDGGGLRTASYQRELYTAGKSKADGIVNESYHQSGNALDFYAYKPGWDSYNRELLAMVACAHLQAASILGYAVEWGGLWEGSQEVYGWDMAHIQLKRETI